MNKRTMNTFMKEIPKEYCGVIQVGDKYVVTNTFISVFLNETFDYDIIKISKLKTLEDLYTKCKESGGKDIEFDLSVDRKFTDNFVFNDTQYAYDIDLLKRARSLLGKCKYRQIVFKDLPLVVGENRHNELVVVMPAKVF